MSLKGSTRENGGSGKITIFVGSDDLSANFDKDFLRNDKNKEALNQ